MTTVQFVQFVQLVQFVQSVHKKSLVVITLFRYNNFLIVKMCNHKGRLYVYPIDARS